MPKPPPFPAHLSLAQFGEYVMRWGTGNAMGRLRISTLTRLELEAADVSIDMARQWRDFYRGELMRNPRNPSALGRAELMDYAVKLLED